ncbi:MAG: hypothetical protein RR177_04075, partial [Oscillospiraceae bacterium]
AVGSSDGSNYDSISSNEEIISSQEDESMGSQPHSVSSNGGTMSSADSPKEDNVPKEDNEAPKPVPPPDIPDKTSSKGVWWWTINDAISAERRTKYLDFLQQNKVTEIYLHAHGMSNSQIGTFISEALSRKMRVAFLLGDYSWIIAENKGFGEMVKFFNDYQRSAKEGQRFYSMHIDVEPHQHPEFSQDKNKIMQLFADFVIRQAAPAAKNSGTLLEWDIPFWMDEFTVKDENNRSINLTELMAKTCDTITIMSYRDTANQMYQVSKEEIMYSKKHGCKIVLGAETYSVEGDSVSYMEEGKLEMNNQLSVLKNRLIGETDNFGIAVHHLNSWYDLKN